ncbi:endonuclease [uncultured Bacteroides sp.]|uniref:endonuclease n=1 Tax=uncultured Bacteroides sp. TaxID=162156 RepID=UPI002AAB4542|nr:endonuclease [uncultured Bacteroides sp.]
MKKIFLYLLMQLLIVCIGGQLIAQVPSGYYSSAVGKKKAELKTALHSIIMNAKVLNYGSGAGSTWSGFAQTDVRPDGTVWDMYSNNKVPVNGNSAASGMNIEHSFPKSWWGGDERQSYRDLYNLNPSNSDANSAKSNYTMAVVDGAVTYSNGVIKVGKSSSRPGGLIDAWEPSDEYKGDFARAYMYMVTCYEDYSNDWTTTSALNELDKNTYPTFQQWAYQLLLKWSQQDPVSDKEINRNNTVSKIQGNRNPFIDYPELAEYIWGAKTETPWSENTDPVLYSPANNSTLDLGVTSISKILEKEVSVSGKNLTGDLAVSVTGTGFSVSTSVLTKDQVTAGAKVTVQYTSASAATSTGTLLLSGGGVSVLVNLTAEAVDGIPVLAASNVTSKSFVASWKNVSDATTKYDFSLYQSDKATLVSGYPVSVNASSETQTVANLTPDTQYYYKLAGGGLSSNLIGAKTLVAVPVVTATPQGGNLDFVTLPNVTSSVKSVTVSTEYINSNISVQVGTPFEISSDQQTWSNTITLASVGGTFYVRMASSVAGSYQSTLSLNCSEITDAQELTVNGSAELAKTFLEDFEKKNTVGYFNGEVESTTGSWVFVNTLIMNGDNSDLKNGIRSARIKPAGSISMNFDKQNGIGTLSLYAGTYGTDVATTLGIYYSSDAGTTWKSVAENIGVSNTFTEYKYSINISGNVRIKIVNLTTSGTKPRVNVDDISMTDYTSTGISKNESDSFRFYVQSNQLVIQNDKTQTICIYNISGQTIYKQKLMPGVTSVTLPQGIYILSGEGVVKKVIVK